MAAQLDLDAILAFTISLAKEAGKIIRDGQQKRFETEASQDEKLNSVDLVTEVDKAVEAFITDKITKQYPDHQFIGEETYTGQKITDEPTWIGMRRLLADDQVHGYPMCCTSIGLAVGGVPVIGVIYNPFLDQLYSAAKGRGAYLNETTRLPLTGKPKPLESLGQSLIGVEYGSSRSAPQLPAKVKAFEKLAAHTKDGGKMVHSLRSAGTAAINIALVATGGLDMYWEIGAGFCILTEAGGVAFGGKTSSLSGDIDAGLMAGRKYLAVRAIAPGEGETALQTQQRFARELYDITDDYDP
ncbi:hypothetical protein JCM24511_05768 [Saitozyma sp. JCM 24511]|nr:hypothetical protein JCM24511_05768 [Saitozyma sp. JCM 24511]